MMWALFHLRNIFLLFLASVLLSLFCCTTAIIINQVGGEYSDFLSEDEEVEYFDSTQTTLPPPPSGRDIDTGLIAVKSSDDSGNSTVTRSPPDKIRIDGKRIPSSPPSSPPHFPQETFDTETGVIGEDQGFVEVRIGEFSATEGFARVYGKLANYSSAVQGEVIQVSEFLGVPFAEAPVKHLRFQRPILKTPSDELLALQHGNPCPQINSDGVVTGNEDCLQLAIYVPRGDTLDDEDEIGGRRPSQSMPVLVWFHGESPEKIQRGQLSMLTSGSAQDLEPFVFLRNKILVVTPQYRLGTLGFLSVANEDLNGNMGLLDQITALEWVQRYITYFGGDPNQVTVMGHGSSAITLGLLSTSSSARSLFHRMILMSGSPTSPLALDTNQKLTYLDVARVNRCPTFPTLQLVRCMQKKDVESIVRADKQFGDGKHIGKLRSPLPVIQKEPDDRFLPPLIHDDPAKRISSGQSQQVPLLIGVTSSEMSGFLGSLSGKSASTFISTLFTSNNVLRQFTRHVLGGSNGRDPSWFGLDSESVAQLVTFEYFAGLNVSERQEQARDLVEEMLSDYLFNMPAVTMATLWSDSSPVYFYVYDYVQNSATGRGKDRLPVGDSFGKRVVGGKRRQTSDVPPAEFPPPTVTANHGSDLLFLMQGHIGSDQDRTLANIMATAWSSFIYKGSPLQSGLEWPTFGRKEYLFLSERIQIRSRFRARQEQFWSELLKQLGDNMECSKTSSPSVSNYFGGNTNKTARILLL